MHDRSPEARSADELLREVSWLRRLARRLVTDAATADDLASDTLVAWSATNAPVHSVRAWLATVLRHFAERQHRRDERRRRAERDAAMPRLERATDESLATAELHKDLVDAVLALDPTYRAAIVLRFLDELPLHEVAHRLDVPVETARTRIRRGLDKLRTRLDERHGGRAAWAALVGVAAPRPLVPALSAVLTMKLLLPAVVVLLAVVAWFSLDESPPPALAQAATGENAADVTSASVEAPAVRSEATTAIPTTEPTSARTVRLRGRAIDEATQLPIADVIVRLVATTPLLAAKVPTTATTTAVDGTFELTVALPERLPMAILLRHPTHARSVLELRGADETPTGFDFGAIEMAPGTVVNGTVFDANGAPVGGAVLFVCRDSFWTDTGRIVRLDEAAPIGRANDDGTFVLDERLVPNRPAPLLLAACDLGLGFVDLEDLQRADATHRVAVTLLPSTTVTVRAVDPERGPVEGATVVAEPRFAPLRLPGIHPVFVERVADLAPTFVRRTDVDGRATLRLPLLRSEATTPYTLRAIANGRDFVVVPVELPAAAEVPIVMPRRRDLVVTGRVVDPDGRGIVGAAVRVRWAGNAAATCGEDGTFRVAIARGPGPLTIEASAPNTFPQVHSATPAAIDTTFDLTLTLEPATTLTGRVTDQHGRPAVGADVWIDEGNAAIETDTNGGFRGPIRGDRPSLVRVTPPEPRSSWEGAVDHVVVPPQHDVTLVLVRRATGRATLDARVLDENGAPLDAQRVVLRRSDATDGLEHPATATIGRVTAGSLGPGPWTLRIVPMRGCEVVTNLTVSGDGERLEPVLQQPAGVTIDGDVRFEPPERLPKRLRLTFASAGQSAHFVAMPGQTIEDGRSTLTIDPANATSFRIDDVDPSRPLVLVASADGMLGELSLAAPGPNARATIVVQPIAFVQITSREPFHGSLLLQLRRPGGAWNDPIRYLGFTGATALFTQPIANGTYEWRLRLPSRGLTSDLQVPWRSGTFTVAAGATSTIELP